MNDEISKWTYTRNGTLFEKFDISKIKNEIWDIFDEFYRIKLKNLLANESELCEKYYPEEGEPDEYFPITLINPGFLRFFEVRYDASVLNEYPSLKSLFISEIEGLQEQINKLTEDGLREIGYLTE